MKNRILQTTSASALALLLVACGAQEPTKTPDRTPSSGIGGAMTNAVNTAADAAKDAAGGAKKMVSDATSGTNAKASETIAMAQSQFREEKFQQALDTLKPLSDLKLDETQQKVVASLKEQIEKAMMAAKDQPKK